MVYRITPFSMTWRTPIPDFKVRPFFDAEYLQNGYRCGHSYYGRRIANRTQAFKWYHFQWHRVRSLTQVSEWVSECLTQGHDNIQRQITRLIVSRVWSVQWFRFQWPCATLNLDLKVKAYECPQRIVCAANARSVCNS